MEKDYFYVRFSRHDYEYYAGRGMRETYEVPENFIPLSEARFGFLSFNGYIRDEKGVVTGCLFEGDELHEVYPGKVYSILSSTTAVDDDGCPEEISFWHDVEIIPCSE